MAHLHPPRSTIHRSHQPPTEGELTFLQFLEDNLNDEYEIYFQPYLNGDRPDIVLMRRGGGVLIIEVKDYNLDLYRVDKNTQWQVKKQGGYWQHISSPFSQVFKYKENLFELHSTELKVGRMNNAKNFMVVTCAVFFANATYGQFSEIAIKPFEGQDQHKKYLKFLSYTEVYTKDTLLPEKLKKHLDTTWISRKSHLFTDKYYQSIKRYLKPPFHYESEGKDILYTPEQKNLISSEGGKRQKVKGVAGCGKTFVLAKRAVNAHLRTGQTVLILTYNLSLVNYIHDRIADVKEDFSWSAFHIINYHQFFKAEANNYGLVIIGLSCWNDARFFEPVKVQIQKYSTVFIDEVQDYRTEWLDLLNTYFVAPDAEYVMYGDEKQNIYDRPLDEQKEIVAKGIGGPWNRSLKTSIRFTENIAKIAARFQQEFMGRKYNIEQIAVINQRELGFSDVPGFVSRIDYFHFEPDATAKDFFGIINAYIKEHGIHSSDVGVLSSTVKIIREIDFLVRTEMKEKTTTTFEKEEFFLEQELSSKELENIRRLKKIHFYMKAGLMKLSTIHSFKGWEIPTLFIVIDDLETDNSGFTSHELIYTAITRAKQNLIVLNAASDNYHQFFLNENGGKESSMSLAMI